MTPKELAAYLNSDEPLRDWGDRHPDMDSLPPISQKLKGALIGHLIQACKTDQGRLSFLHAIFGVTTSKALDDHQWATLYAWLDPRMNSLNHKYEISRGAEYDARRLLYELAHPPTESMDKEAFNGAG